MVRRLFVPVLLVALALGAAPSPSFGLGGSDVRPRAGDHLRCMYRCEERGEFRPPPRRPSWGSWPSPRPRPRPPARPSWHRPGCWLFCGDGGWSGRGGWSGPQSWCRPDPGYGGWYGHSGPYGYGGWFSESARHRRPCRPDNRGWHHRPHRRHDDSRGYDAHRHHPRSRDF